jgi:hypothetical protein
LMVDGLTALLKVAVIVLPTDTFRSPQAGFVEITPGLVPSVQADTSVIVSIMIIDKTRQSMFLFFI